MVFDGVWLSDLVDRSRVRRRGWVQVFQSPFTPIHSNEVDYIIGAMNIRQKPVVVPVVDSLGLHRRWDATIELL